jgi:hypothetical protein
LVVFFLPSGSRSWSCVSWLSVTNLSGGFLWKDQGNHEAGATSLHVFGWRVVQISKLLLSHAIRHTGKKITV